MKINLKTLIEARECFSILRDAEGDKRFLQIKEYRRVVRSFGEFDALVSMIAREHEVEVTND